MGVSSVTSFLLHISSGWVLLIVLGTFAFFDSIRSGSARSTALALAFPLAYLVLTFVSGAEFISGIAKQFSSGLAQGLFATFVLGIAFVLMYRIVDTSADVGFLQALASALGLVVMTALFWQLIPEFSGLWSPGAQVAVVFGEGYRFWWFLLAVVSLAFAKG